MDCNDCEGTGECVVCRGGSIPDCVCGATHRCRSCSGTGLGEAHVAQRLEELKARLS